MVKGYIEGPFATGGAGAYFVDRYDHSLDAHIGNTVRHTTKLGAMLRTKSKPGGYSYLYSKVRPVDYDKIDKTTRLKIISAIVWDDLDRTAKRLKLLDLGFKTFEFQILRFVSALEYWYKYSEGDKIDHPKEIIRKFFMDGSVYTAYLDDLTKYAVQAWHQDVSSYRHDTYDTDVEHKYNNYNYTPPLFIFPLLSVKIEDWKYMLDDPPPIDGEIIDEFKDAITSYVQMKIEPILDSELYRPTTSASRTFSGETGKFYQNLLDYPKPVYTKNVTGYRTVIPIACENWRDAVTLDIPSYFTMRKVDLLFAQILNDIPYSITCNNARQSKRRFRRLFSKNTYNTQAGTYYMRDVKKSGLTMPIKQLGPVIRSILTKKYPGLGFELIEALENFCLVLDDDKKTRHRPKRGLGLGMGNNIWTFLQCMAFYVLRQKIDLPIDALFGNDDSIIFIPREDGRDHDDDVHQIIDIDQQLMASLGIQMNLKKTCVSPWPIFYEEYGLGTFSNKSGRFIANLGSVRMCSNIYEAKLLTSSILSNTKLDLGFVLDELVKYWGYEFHPKECLFTLEMGGWYQKRENGLSPALIDMYKHRDILTYIVGATMACKDRQSITPKPLFDMFDESRKMIPENVRVMKAIPPEKMVKSSFLFMTYKEVTHFFDRIVKYKDNVSSRVKRIAKIRQAVYRDRPKAITIAEARLIILNHVKDVSIPDEEVVISSREYDFDETVLANPYGIEEETVHDELCSLHEEGYIVYEDYHSRFRSRINSKRIAEIYGKAYPDIEYEEYDQYSKNTDLLLTDWILRHRQHYDWYPAIPIFYKPRDRSIKNEEFIMRDITSNCIIPLSKLYGRLRPGNDLRTILDINDILLAYQDEWLSDQEQIARSSYIDDIVPDKICGTHQVRDRYFKYEEMQQLGYKLETSNIHCPRCRIEAAWKVLYFREEESVINADFTQDDADDLLLETMEQANREEEYGDEEFINEDPDAIVVEEGDDILDDYEEEPNE